MYVSLDIPKTSRSPEVKPEEYNKFTRLWCRKKELWLLTDGAAIHSLLFATSVDNSIWLCIDYAWRGYCFVFISFSPSKHFLDFSFFLFSDIFCLKARKTVNCCCVKMQWAAVTGMGTVHVHCQFCSHESLRCICKSRSRLVNYSMESNFYAVCNLSLVTIILHFENFSSVVKTFLIN